MNVMTNRRNKPQTFASCIIYLRVSTEHQRMSGLGREAQEAACRAYAERQGWTVRAVYVDEGLSGKLPIAERPGLAAALADAKPGEAFVVYSLSRAFRTQREAWQTVEGPGGEPALPLVSATEPFDLTTAFGRAAFGMLATFARLEADLASDRTAAALDAARERGTKLGAPSIAATAVKSPEVAASLARARALRAEGKSYRAIVETLNAEGLPAARGGRWYLKTVAAALSEPEA